MVTSELNAYRAGYRGRLESRPVQIIFDLEHRDESERAGAVENIALRRHDIGTLCEVARPRLDDGAIDVSK